MVESSCILPYYEPPDSGRITHAIGSELTQLFYNPDSIGDTTNNSNTVFQIINGNVVIEVICNIGQYNTTLALLQTPPYGMTNLIDNGDTTLIITGSYPIANLLKLDSLPTLINYVRPYFPPITSTTFSGLIYSHGDIAQRSDSARLAFGVEGEGVKVGVISDSYNKNFGNPAATDLSNGYFPGPGKYLQLKPGRGTLRLPVWKKVGRRPMQ